MKLDVLSKVYNAHRGGSPDYVSLNFLVCQSSPGVGAFLPLTCCLESTLSPSSFFSTPSPLFRASPATPRPVFPRYDRADRQTLNPSFPPFTVRSGVTPNSRVLSPDNCRAYPPPRHHGCSCALPMAIPEISQDHLFGGRGSCHGSQR